MATFEAAIEYLLRDEGGKVDESGPSKWGVLLSVYRQRVPGATYDDIVNLTREQAVAYYQMFCWNTKFEAIANQDLANKIFSTYVNMDADAIRFVQRGLRDLFKLPIVDDGVFGSRTLEKLNTVNAGDLLREFRAQQAKHYAEWYDGAPKERDHLLLGLMRRAIE